MKFLVTAGPTREPIDPVRFISNRSSGKMGYCVAAAAADRGHEVVLVSGPVALLPPDRIRMVRVVTAADMLEEVSRYVDWCDVLVMAAAVADWRPASASETKWKKSKMPVRLELMPTTDILSSIAPRKENRLFVGFAAETGDVSIEAIRKLRDKNLDLIVANDVSMPGAGFDVDTNQVSFFGQDSRVDLPLLPKKEVANRILLWIEARHVTPTT